MLLFEEVHDMRKIVVISLLTVLMIITTACNLQITISTKPTPTPEAVQTLSQLYPQMSKELTELASSCDDEIYQDIVKDCDNRGQSTAQTRILALYMGDFSVFDDSYPNYDFTALTSNTGNDDPNSSMIKKLSSQFEVLFVRNAILESIRDSNAYDYKTEIDTIRAEIISAKTVSDMQKTLNDLDAFLPKFDDTYTADFPNEQKIAR